MIYYFIDYSERIEAISVIWNVKLCKIRFRESAAILTILLNRSSLNEVPLMMIIEVSLFSKYTYFKEFLWYPLKSWNYQIFRKYHVWFLDMIVNEQLSIKAKKRENNRVFYFNHQYLRNFSIYRAKMVIIEKLRSIAFQWTPYELHRLNTFWDMGNKTFQDL